MEKYTFDIDKVLDDFEETEALKIYANKKSEGCVEQRSISSCSTFEEIISPKDELIQEKNPGNSWVEAALDIDASDSSNTSLSQNNTGLDDHLNSISQHLIDGDSHFYGTSKLAANINKFDVHSDEDKTTKNLSYDIFYKPREPDSSLKRKHSNTCDFGVDDSPDEILCVAVEENKPEMSIESQVTVLESHIANNFTQLNDFVIEGSQSNSEFSEDTVLTKEEMADNHNPDTELLSHVLENSESLLNQSKVCRPTQLSLTAIALNETLIETNGPVSEDISSPESPLNFYSEEFVNLPKDGPHFVSTDAKPQSDSLPLVDNCNTQTTSENDTLPVCNSLDANNVSDMRNIQLINDEFVACAAEVPRNALDLQNGFGTQDDDSGVSSTEDISGNSPPQLNREPANSVVNENCDIEVVFPKEPSLDKNSSISSGTANLESCNKTELQESFSCREATPLEKIIEDEVKEFTLNSHRIQSEHSFRTEENMNNEEPKSCCVSNEISSTDSIISETINKNTTTFDSQIVETACQLENATEPSNFSLTTTNTELQTSDPNSVIPIDNEKTSQTDLKQNALEDEAVECTQDSNLALIGNDCISPRLQRPTTLDIPSIISSSDNTDEALEASGTTDTHLIPSDDSLGACAAVPVEPIAGMIPYVRQQPHIGLVKPYWIPDSEAVNCMHCGMKFTVIKRRHHCRGCGKVLCSKCCNQRAFLAYMKKEDRICQPCAEVLSSPSQNDHLPVPFDSHSSSSCGSSPNFSPSPQMPNTNHGDKSLWRPHPNNPDDYCSTIPPLQQIQAEEAKPPPTVMVPIGNKPKKEPKQVIFSDGIRPGGDLTDLTEPAESSVPLYRRMSRKRVDKMLAVDSRLGTGALSSISPYQKGRQKRIIVSDGEGPLPPVVLQIGSGTDEKMDWNKILQKIQDDSQKAVNFALMKNMHLFVKITKLDCCFGNECWCFTSHGLCTVGQDEVMIILERLPGESNIPRDIFKLFSHVYDSASKGATFNDLGHIIFPEHILGSSDHRGFLFVRPTFQCLSKLTVPNTPYLVAILIHKWEVPWAKVFPLRLMLRMGAECRYYPCSLVSIRHRKPVYFEIGQTIMSVLADLRNFQFTIPVIAGLVVHMEEKKTCVNIPRNRYEKMMKILNNNNVEHVLALGSNFSTEADSHLVCMQKEEGDYQTQAINIENTTRKVTGASFIIFSGALKSTSGLSAKFSIVEDGLLIQISQDTMVALHMALRDMRDLKIECGQINAEPEETVLLQWTRDDKKFNIGVKSPIDGKSFEGVNNLRIHSATDYAGENYLIRWTEVFFLDVEENSSSIQNELVDPCRLAETIAQSCCMALTPYLDQLAEAELIKLGLRLTLDSQSDQVGYDIGSRGKALPSLYMNALDSGLIPVISRLSSSTHSEKLSFELIFHILIK